ncbi:MAG: efflux RND transporter permease subunit [Planctomycetia bacterium]|nr:efflux RND transporter permease subunit [Planctomycetia bacterium]
MLNFIIDASLRHRFAVIALSAVLAAWGAWSAARLPVDAFPDVTDVMVQVNTVAPGTSPEEMELQVSARIEAAMGGMPGLKLVKSMSKYSLSQVTLVFEDGTDVWKARGQVLERLQGVELPGWGGKPEMGPVATGLGEVFHYVVTARGTDPTAARTHQDWILKPRLQSVPGVAEVNSWGGFERQVQVAVDTARLVKHGLTLNDVLEALERSNLNVAGGVARGSGEDLVIRGVGAAATAEDVGGVAVQTVDGLAVRVRDVADVRDGWKLRTGVVTHQGRGEAVLGLGFMLMGENSRDVTARLRARFEEVKAELPAGTGARVLYDRTELVDKVLRTVRTNLSEGALLVVAVLFLFLGNFRAALIVASAIPLSMLFAASAMVQAGIAGTVMSLGAIDFGLIVDSTVIVVENSVRRLDSDTTGRPVREIVADAVREVRAPTLFGELIIMIVYVPVLALHGVEGKLFRPMALTLIFALAGSMLFSLTLMPALASLLLRRGRAHAEPWIVRTLRRAYAPVVRFAVEHRALVLGAALLTVAGSVPIALRLPTTFVPKFDEGTLVVSAVRFPGVGAEESARFSTRVERLLLDRFPPEIRDVWTRSGTPEVATDPMGMEQSDIFVTLRPRGEWTKARTREELVRAVEGVLRPLPGLAFVFSQPIEMRFNEMVAGVRTDVGVKVFADDFEQLRELAGRVAAVLARVPGAEEPQPERLTGQPVLEVRLDPEALSRHGLRAADVLDLVEAAGGRQAGEIRDGQRRFPLAVTLPDSVTATPETFQNLLVPTPAGSRLPLARLARVRRVSGPLVINREWGKRRAIVSVNVKGGDLGGFVREARRRIEAELGAELKSKGARVEFGGQYENLVRAAGTLAWVVPLALLLILVLVGATYGNLPDSLRVFTGVPFAAAGGVLALHVCGLPFSVSAAVGFVALSGVSVLADMVMVSRIRQLAEEGLAVKDAALEAAQQRLRPVLMTALVAGLGFLPMAASTGVGAEVQRPLATVVIGGLFTSTLLTLFVLPTLYVALRGRRPA